MPTISSVRTFWIVSISMPVSTTLTTCDQQTACLRVYMLVNICTPTTPTRKNILILSQYTLIYPRVARHQILVCIWSESDSTTLTTCDQQTAWLRVYRLVNICTPRTPTRKKYFDTISIYFDLSARSAPPNPGMYLVRVR